MADQSSDRTRLAVQSPNRSKFESPSYLGSVGPYRRNHTWFSKKITSDWSFMQSAGSCQAEDPRFVESENMAQFTSQDNSNFINLGDEHLLLFHLYFFV